MPATEQIADVEALARQLGQVLQPVARIVNLLMRTGERDEEQLNEIVTRTIAFTLAPHLRHAPAELRLAVEVLEEADAVLRQEFIGFPPAGDDR